jgi:hypothetical protein
MSARQFGFAQARRVVMSIRPEMKKAQIKSLTRFGIKAEAIAVAHISNQDLGWKALTPKYLAQKVREGKSELTLVATASYFKAITSWVMSDTVYVGVKRTVRNPNGEEIANIAKILEYGTKDSAARPLWTPTLREAIAWHNLNNTPEKHFMEAMRRVANG